MVLVTGVAVVVVVVEAVRKEEDGPEEETEAMEDDNDTGLVLGLLLASPATRDDSRFRLERSSEVGVAVAEDVLGCSRTGVAALLGGALLLGDGAAPPFRFPCSGGSVVGLTRGMELESLAAVVVAVAGELLP